MLGTVQKVWPKGLTKNGKNGPASVVFSDGKKLSTFDDALIAMASNGIGQQFEYTIERNGQYENLGSLTLKGAVPAQQQPSSAPAVAAQGVANLDDVLLAIRSIAERLREQTTVIRERAVQMARSVNPLYRVEAGKAPVLVPEPVQSAIDPLVEAEAALAKAVESPEAARAMFEAIRAKYTTKAGVLDVDKALFQARKTLAGHGVEV